MYKTWNIGLIPNKINIVPGFHLLCVICIYKTDDFFSLTCFKFFCSIVLPCVSRMPLQTKHCQSKFWILVVVNEMWQVGVVIALYMQKHHSRVTCIYLYSLQRSDGLQIKFFLCRNRTEDFCLPYFTDGADLTGNWVSHRARSQDQSGQTSIRIKMKRK